MGWRTCFFERTSQIDLKLVLYRSEIMDEEEEGEEILSLRKWDVSREGGR